MTRSSWSIHVLVLANALLPFAAATTWTLPSWLIPWAPPSPGSGTATSQIQCYALPYGFWGFLSHLLSYYTVVVLGYFGHAPLLPWNPVEHSRWDFSCGVVSLVVTCITSAIAVNRCRGSWPFVLVALWKLLLGFSLGMIVISRGRKARDKDDTREPTIWGVFYIPGVVCGCIGMLRIVHDALKDPTEMMKLVLGSFGGTLALVVGVFLVIAFCSHDFFGGLVKAVLVGCAAVAFLFALFSDWFLAAIEVQAGGSFWGWPGDDVAWLFWLYFIGKRLPLLSL